MIRKGWFKIPGVQDGDRTLDEQIEALRPALAEAGGKTVLDLGCAEGLIGREFIRAGARSCLGLDSLPGHLAVARQQCADHPNMVFEVANLNIHRPALPRFDIVLALGVLHKMEHPEPVARWTIGLAGGLILFRAKGGVSDGVITSKHFKTRSVNAHALLLNAGFAMEKVVDGANGESVEYWRLQS